jgi:hypothetical protein
MNAKDFLDKHATIIEGKYRKNGSGIIGHMTVEFLNKRFYVNGCKWWTVGIYSDPGITKEECHNVFYGFVKYCGISKNVIHEWVLDKFETLFMKDPHIYREE